MAGTGAAELFDEGIGKGVKQLLFDKWYGRGHLLKDGGSVLLLSVSGANRSLPGPYDRMLVLDRISRYGYYFSRTPKTFYIHTRTHIPSPSPGSSAIPRAVR